MALGVTVKGGCGFIKKRRFFDQSVSILGNGMMLHFSSAFSISAPHPETGKRRPRSTASPSSTRPPPQSGRTRPLEFSPRYFDSILT